MTCPRWLPRFAGFGGFEQYAREVMDALEQHGQNIVAHLFDTDDNSGEHLRRALNGDEDC
jgi:hypothetical protein